MTHAHGPLRQTQSPADAPLPDDEARAEHGHSMWWMVACCAPMVLLALAILLGAFGPR